MAKSDIDYVDLGFAVWTGQPRLMHKAHRHGEVEANFIMQGSVTYLTGGRMVKLPMGRWVLFWAAVPHELVHLQPGTRMGWATVPLNWFLHWPVPESVRTTVLTGRLIVDAHPEAHDAPTLQRMAEDCTSDEPVRRQLLVQEIEVRFCRLMLQNPDTLGPVQGRINRAQAAGSTPQLGKVEQMAAFIARHYREDLRIERIAAEVNLHPNYAMTLFREHVGMSLGAYLTRQRLWQAQRLLAVTDKSILEVATASGFGSLSRFYEAFAQGCKTTPRAYRTALRKPRRRN